MKDLLSRLKRLEAQNALHPIPDRKQWGNIWEGLSALDKVLILSDCINLELIPPGSYRKYIVAASAFLREMNLIDDAAQTLIETARELDEGRMQ